MDNPRLKQTAATTLQLNAVIAAILFCCSLTMSLLDFPSWPLEWTLLLIYSAVTFVLCCTRYFPIPIVQILLQLLGDLLHLAAVPVFWRRKPCYAVLLVVGGTLLLWLPLLTCARLPRQGGASILPFLLIGLWTLCFRALDYAEQRQVVPADSWQMQEQREIQFWAIWLVILLICAVGCLLPLLPLINSFLQGQNISCSAYQQLMLLFFSTALCVILLTGLFYRRSAKRARAALEQLQLQH